LTAEKRSFKTAGRLANTGVTFIEMNPEALQLPGSDVLIRVKTENIVHQTIDGEVVLINLLTGHYFSIEGAGTAIWERISLGTTRMELQKLLESSYEGQPAELEAGLSRFLADLLEEGMIEYGSADSNEPLVPNSVESLSPATRQPFAAPVLNVYTDMKDFLLLDPIHDVGEAGWPNSLNKEP